MRKRLVKNYLITNRNTFCFESIIYKVVNSLGTIVNLTLISTSLYQANNNGALDQCGQVSRLFRLLSLFWSNYRCNIPVIVACALIGRFLYYKLRILLIPPYKLCINYKNTPSRQVYMNTEYNRFIIEFTLISFIHLNNLAIYNVQANDLFMQRLFIPQYYQKSDVSLCALPGFCSIQHSYGQCFMCCIYFLVGVHCAVDAIGLLHGCSSIVMVRTLLLFHFITFSYGFF